MFVQPQRELKRGQQGGFLTAFFFKRFPNGHRKLDIIVLHILLHD